MPKPSPAPARSRHERRLALLAAAERALVGAAVVLHLAVYRHDVTGDGAVRWDTAVALAHGRLTASTYGLVHSILALPLVPLGRGAGAYLNEILFLAGLGALVLLLRRTLDAALLRRFALIALCASMFTNAVRDHYGETLSAFALAIAVTLALRERPGAAGAAAVLAVINAPATAPAVGAALLAALRRRRVLVAGAAVAAAGALVLCENWIRRGSPLASGYEGNAGYRTFMPYSGRPGFSYPLVLGAASLAFSFGKGVLLFAPGLWLWLRREWRRPDPPLLGRLVGAWLVAGLVLLLTYSKWWAWYGGWTWGPRFLLFASLPASLLLAHALGDRAAPPLAKVGVVAALALSAWVGTSGALFGLDGLSACTAGNYRNEVLCWYVPEFSPLVRPLLAARSLSAGEWFVALHAAAVVVVLGAGMGFGEAGEAGGDGGVERGRVSGGAGLVAGGPS